MADYACQEPGWVYRAPPCRRPDEHPTGHCGCSYVAILWMRANDIDPHGYNGDMPRDTSS